MNSQWTLIEQAIKTELDRQCPINNFNFNKAKPPYIHKHILEQMRNRDYFYRKAKLTHNDDDWNIFLRNQTNSNIRRARAEVIQNELENNRNDSPRFWRTIHQIFPSKSDKTHGDIKLTNNGVDIEHDATAQYINDFFVNVGNILPGPVGENTNPTIRPKTPDPADSIIVHPQDAYSFSAFTETEVYDQTKKLNTAKSSGIPDISATVVKLSLKMLNAEFTHLLNTSLSTSKFPNEWKKATVTPIPKKGNLKLVNNYHPISLLPTPGKVMEKLVHKQLIDYIEDNNLLSDHQYGFRRNRSTLQAVTQVVNHVNNNHNKKVKTVAIFIYLKKSV